MWNLKYGTNEPIYKTETGTQTQIRLWLPRRGGEKRDGLVGRCKQLHLEWIATKFNAIAQGNISNLLG